MKHEPMTQERLDAIQARVDGATNGPWGCYGDGAHEVFDAGEYSDGDRGEVVAAVIDKLSDAVFIAEAREDIPALLAEVQRLKRFESIMSWRYGDTTDGRTREDMVERAAQAYFEDPIPSVDDSLRPKWDPLVAAYPGVADNYRRHMRAALDAALGTGEGA